MHNDNDSNKVARNELLTNMRELRIEMTQTLADVEAAAAEGRIDQAREKLVDLKRTYGHQIEALELALEVLA